ncbi:hypothetical protein Avbf_09242 [Armadillidium vulgare]|nr:hypothetical protein Avbf_09242 [Armadillidium vulgare]
MSELLYLFKKKDLNVSERVTPWEYLMHVVELIETCKASDNPLTCLFNLNMHYKPFYISCSPCVLHFDVIAKLSTYEEDLRYITLKVEEIYARQNSRLDTKDKTLISEKIKQQKWILKVLKNSITGQRSNPKRF